MIIRKAKLNECDVLDHLLTLLIRDEKQYDSSINPTFTIIGYYENFVNDVDKCLLVAEEDNKIIGYLYGFKKEKDPVCEKNEYLLDALYVTQEYRNKNVASMLINEFKSWCLNEGATCISVKVCSENKTAKELYKKKSFKTFAEIMMMELK